MKPNAIVLMLFIAVIISFGSNSCKHEIPSTDGTNGTPITGGGQTCSQDTVYFQNSVLPLLNSGCAMSGCHDAISRKDGVELTSYSKIISTGGVVPGNPSNSKLYKVLNRTGSDRMPPPPAAGFTTAQKDIVYKWIQQGAKNNSCNGCDSSVFTYSGAIAPLMNTYCKGCHNPASLGGGIDVSSYALVKLIAQNGKLMGSIAHASGYSSMPKGSAKLSDCQIRQVQKWIQTGILNN
jgi:mono/diheme cytochrome c family protein